jgi:glycosyltransferase involved in cell wall biosynthesis
MDITKGYVAQGADLVVWNTDWVAEDFNYDGLQCIVHPRVDGDRFKFPKGHRKANQEYITLVNLWAGSIKGQNGKGPEVFYALAERFPDHKFLGVIGGYGEQDIRNLPNVTIQKHTPDMVKDVYAKTKVLLMPSRYESFGRVALEGAFLGIPTIANPTLGLTEALGSGGIYADRDDSAAWAMALEDLLEPDIYKKASDYAKTRAKFWKSKQSAELETFLRHAWHLGQQCLLLRGW